MLVMLAQRGDVELVRDACEWLVGVYRRDCEAGARQKGASAEQAVAAARNATEDLQKAAEGINDRNVVGMCTSIVDTCFSRHYNAGKPTYDKAMAWFADELRKKIRD